ncbi:uncharacterized protein LOC129598288 [Paramacrobiotus metropolitanus]|uniref:uncharacterized protein LOC129598288 n=1 Tax=Paramacrobiotus metropolitanus TaxID=2943436 RepID=UPI002445DD81|nr:uncharacterized protein LOC129598288 [Paramacrobiotus metropolitanus]XP_055352086.1 uncharacterized protein LOC129598288 [Paramacrobiotus metropolitanus]
MSGVNVNGSRLGGRASPDLPPVADSTEEWTWASLGGTAVNDSCGRTQATPFVSANEAAIWLTRLSFPVLLLVGTLGNSLGIWLVLKERRHGRRRGSRPLDRSRARKIFLLALFGSDLCYLWNRLIFLLITDAWTPAESSRTIGETWLALYTHGLFGFVDALLSFSSQGILVAFCVDRYYALTSPLRHKTQRSLGRAASFLVVGVIYAGNAGCSTIIPIFYYWTLTHRPMFPAPGDPLPDESSFQPLPEVFLRWLIVDAWGEVIIRFGSALVIIVLNRLIFLKLRQCSARMSGAQGRLPGLSNSPSLLSSAGAPPTYNCGPRVVPAFHLQLTVTDPAERDVHYTLSTSCAFSNGHPAAGAPRTPTGVHLPRSSSYFAANGPASTPVAPAAPGGPSRASFRTSRSANLILLCSSVFYLVTNSLDLALSLVSVLGMYPLCLTDKATEITYACDPFRDLLRHSYFAFSFMFYVCLKLRRRPDSGIRRRSSSYVTSNPPAAAAPETLPLYSKRTGNGASRQNSARSTAALDPLEDLTAPLN